MVRFRDSSTAKSPEHSIWRMETCGSQRRGNWGLRADAECFSDLNANSPICITKLLTSTSSRESFSDVVHIPAEMGQDSRILSPSFPIVRQCHKQDFQSRVALMGTAEDLRRKSEGLLGLQRALALLPKLLRCHSDWPYEISETNTSVVKSLGLPEAQTPRSRCVACVTPSIRSLAAVNSHAATIRTILRNISNHITIPEKARIL